MPIPYKPMTREELRQALVDLYTLESFIETELAAKNRKEAKKMAKASIKKSDGCGVGELRTFPFTLAPMLITISPRIASICTGSGFPYTADVRIAMIPDLMVLEYMSLDAELKRLVNQPMLGEEAAACIFNMVWAAIHPRYLRVDMCSHGIAHSPMTVQIEAQKGEDGRPVYTSEVKS